jgi:hypothetical protein
MQKGVLESIGETFEPTRNRGPDTSNGLQNAGQARSSPQGDGTSGRFLGSLKAAPPKEPLIEGKPSFGVVHLAGFFRALCARMNRY